MAKTATFKRYVNDYTTAEQELHRRSGERVTVEPLEEQAYDREEVGPMFRITFADGYESDAFEGELTEWSDR